MSVSMACTAASPLAVSYAYSRRKQTYGLSSSITIPISKSSTCNPSVSTSLVGFNRLPVWSGLKHLDISLRRSTKEVKGRRRGKVVYASLFGVGAPEALVVGVVALLVFGPKGLAEVARNLGKTLRAFQPTLRELQDVSREFRSTLQNEIGLDEIQSTLQRTYESSASVNEKPQTVADPDVQVNNTPNSSEELLNITEEQLASAAAAASQENTTNTAELSPGVVADKEALMDTPTSSESGSTATASDYVTTESTTPADVPSTLAATGTDSNVSLQ